MKNLGSSVAAMCLYTNALWAQESFACWRDDSQLSDSDFLEAAFDHEVSNGTLPPELSALGMDGVLRVSPDCCRVLRVDNPFNAGRGFVSRLLTHPTVWIIVHWPPTQSAGPGPSTDYDMTVCGEVLKRRGSTEWPLEER